MVSLVVDVPDYMYYELLDMFQSDDIITNVLFYRLLEIIEGKDGENW